MIIENSSDKQSNPWQDSDLLVKAQVARPEIQLLAKYVEGMGHLGVVTTINNMTGEVIIQTTKYCWPELKKNISLLPIEVTLLES